MTEVRVREVPERHVVVEKHEVDQAALVAMLPGSMARVAEAARERGGQLGTAVLPYLERDDRPDEPVFVVVYGGDPNEGPVSVEVCAPVEAGGDAVEPAHREAYVRVTKRTVVTGELGPVYGLIERWVDENGHTVAAPPRETYWTDFMGAGLDDEVFDVSFPIA